MLLSDTFLTFTYLITSAYLVSLDKHLITSAYLVSLDKLKNMKCNLFGKATLNF